MATLSIIQDHSPARVVANPIFPLRRITVHEGSEIEFEVFEVDAGQLKPLVGMHRCFSIDQAWDPFWALFRSLEPCVSTHPGLALIRRANVPTLRGVLVVVEGAATRQ